MTEETYQQNRIEFSGKQEIHREFCKRKPYEKPILQPLNTSADIIAGGSTSNQLENSSGLIGS